MKRYTSVLTVFLMMLFCMQVAQAEGVFAYEKPKVPHPGREITPLEAFAMMKEDPARMILVDVRTQAEYQFVGHPKNAYLVPFQFIGTDFREKEYAMINNKDFVADLMKRFNPKIDTLFFLCRSGTRAALALTASVKAGWPAEQAYVILGGFEGGKMKDKNSAFYGQRVGGGWRNAGLPWTYAMEPELVY